MEKVKINNTMYEIKNIQEYSNLLKIEFNYIEDLTNIDLSSIEVYTSGNVFCREFSNYNTIYKQNDNVVILSNDGSIYKEPDTKNSTPIEPHVPTEEEIATQLVSAKKSKITESNKKLEEFLLNNPLLFTDGNYYSVTMEKQNLLTSALTLYNLKLNAGLNPVFKWNSTGDTCVEMPIETGMALAISIGTYVEPIVEQQRIIEKQINMCTTIDEVNSVVIKYEITS